MAELIKVNQEKETAIFKLVAIGGDPLEIHSIVYTAEKYHQFLSEEPGEKKHWVKY